MSKKKYLIISGSIFSIVSLLHLIRAILCTEILIGSWVVPIWPSWGGFIGAGLLAVWAFRSTK
ncbi:hypothetical protein ACFLQG_00980 [Candidatus Zixiibacteriota bacterium]